MLCEGCANFEEHCTCYVEACLASFDWGGEIASHMATPPPCPPTCICEACIEEAMNQALLGQGGVMPGEALTSHLGLTCECGSDKVGSPYHSDYCPKFKKGE